MARDWSQEEEQRWGAFRFVAQQGRQTITVEIAGDSNLSDTLDAIESFLIAAGFNAQQVKSSFQ